MGKNKEVEDKDVKKDEKIETKNEKVKESKKEEKIENKKEAVKEAKKEKKAEIKEEKKLDVKEEKALVKKVKKTANNDTKIIMGIVIGVILIAFAIFGFYFYKVNIDYVVSYDGGTVTKADYKVYGGAPFLGVKRPVLKAHGSSDETVFYYTLKQAEEFAKGNSVEKMTKDFLEYKNPTYQS